MTQSSEAAIGGESKQRPVIDSKEFRRVLSCFPTGVAIITTLGAKGEPLGLTCNSFSSVSLNPPLVLWSLGENSRSRQAFLDADAFAINVLAEGQSELSNRFATGDIDNKFENVAYSKGHGGVPVLDGCVARFHCSVFAKHETGDHVIFIGRVEQFDQGRQEDSLVFYKGAYMTLTQSLVTKIASGRITRDALIEARSTIYRALVGLACENAQERDFDDIEQNLRDLDQYVEKDDMLNRARTAIEYFDLITHAAHNEVLSVIARSLSVILQHKVRESVEPERLRSIHLPALMDIRWEILEHLRARDIESAITAISHYFAIVAQSGSSLDKRVEQS